MTSRLFVETSVSRDIYKTIDLARELHKNAAIVGRPGVGKSYALGAYAQERGAHFLTVTAVSGNALRDLFRELAEVLYIHTSGSIANMQRQMFRYDLSDRVLIIDEAQNLKLQAYRELLHLYDFAGMVLVFCGNEEVLKRVRTDKGAFAQISRRVPVRAEVNSILNEDADNLASAFGIKDGDAFKLMRAIGAAYHTDGVVSILEIARRLANARPIRAADIRAACDALPHYRSAITRAHA